MIVQLHPETEAATNHDSNEAVNNPNDDQKPRRITLEKQSICPTIKGTTEEISISLPENKHQIWMSATCKLINI